MNAKRREYMVGVLVIRVPLCPHPIDVSRAQTVFLEEEGHRREGVEERTKVIKEIRGHFRRFFYKKIILISHFLEEN